MLDATIRKMLDDEYTETLKAISETQASDDAAKWQLQKLTELHKQRMNEEQTERDSYVHFEELSIQSHRKARNFPFLMGEHVWKDSEKLDADDEIGEVLKHGTLSIGFIGLAEALKALIGEHHGESKAAQMLGLTIVKCIRAFCDGASKKYGMNITCLATPAESLSGRFVRMDRERYGTIPGVTDHDYYTNSFHIPVYYPISAFKKIELEAPYHALTNAGHISYVELDGDPSMNLQAFEKIVRHMKECGIGYGSINHPVDRDPECGYNGIIGDECPRCGRHEYERLVTETVRRTKDEP